MDTDTPRAKIRVGLQIIMFNNSVQMSDKRHFDEVFNSECQNMIDYLSVTSISRLLIQLYVCIFDNTTPPTRTPPP